MKQKSGIIIRCAKMFLQNGLVFLVVPLALFPKTIHLVVNSAGIVVTNHLAEFIHLLYTLHRP